MPEWRQAVCLVSLAFGLTATPTYKWLKFLQKVLLAVLHKHLLAIVSKPTWQEVDSYVEAIGNRYAWYPGYPLMKGYQNK